jgi:hypothetical protein
MRLAQMAVEIVAGETVEVMVAEVAVTKPKAAA